MPCSQQANLHLSKPRRITIFILGFTDSLLFGGAIFGWPQLVYILKSQNIYSYLCDDNFYTNNPNVSDFQNKSTEGHLNGFPERCSAYQNLSSEVDDTLKIQSSVSECLAQDERFALIFTLAVLCFGVPGIAIGFLLHYAGLRFTRMLGGFLISASFFCLSVTTEDSSNWLFPSIMLLALGGNTLRMSSMQMGDLFPSCRSTAITVMSGVYAASASLFLTFSMMAEVGISTVYVSYFFAGLSGVSALFSFIMPVHHIPYENENENTSKLVSSRSSVPLTKSLLTWSSFLHLYYFFIGLFVMNVYQQNYNVWVTASSCSMEETRVFTNWYSYSNLICVFMAPVGGAFTDYMVKRAKKDTSNRIDFLTKSIQANFVPLFVTNLLTLVMYGCFFFTHPISIIISLISMIVVRPCVIAISTAYIRIRFPGEHFNRLLGIYSTVASVLLFLQYPHFNWSQQMYYVTHLITLLFVAASLSNPLHLLRTSYLQAEVKEQENIDETQALQEKEVDKEHLDVVP